MQPFLALLVLFALVSLVAFGFVIRWERRQFLARGKQLGWRRVRIASIPIALLAAAVVIVSTQAVSGMEGLAVFYGLLLLVAPVLWFGAHWLVGRTASPPLSFGESAAIAGSPIAFALLASYVAHALQTPAWTLLRSLGLA
jgi:hypothetical protein